MSAAGLQEQARLTADVVARRSYGKLVAFLAARTHDVAAAEDALSDAFATALTDWPRTGPPVNPEAWLLTVARRKAIDAGRRQRNADAASGDLHLVLESLAASHDTEIPDRRLALMFACAHPSLEPGSADHAGGSRLRRESHRLGVPRVAIGDGQASGSRQE